jgi:hypothetical protein
MRSGIDGYDEPWPAAMKDMINSYRKRPVIGTTGHRQIRLHLADRPTTDSVVSLRVGAQQILGEASAPHDHSDVIGKAVTDAHEPLRFMTAILPA